MSGDRYFIVEQHAPYYVTFTVVDWVDVFTRMRYRQIVVDSLNYCIKEKGLIVWGWCLMSNHMHAILQAKEGRSLSNIIRDFKKFTSKAIVASINEGPESRREWMLRRFEWAANSDKRITNYKFWQESNHAIYLDSNFPEMFSQKLNYIHTNPVRAGIVADATHYLYSSANDYAGFKGLVVVQLAM